MTVAQPEPWGGGTKGGRGPVAVELAEQCLDVHEPLLEEVFEVPLAPGALGGAGWTKGGAEDPH